MSWRQTEDDLNPVTGTVSSEELIVTGVAEESKRENITAFIGEQIRGPRGLSAYEIAVLEGFLGSEEEWLTSIATTGVEVSKEPLNRMEKKADGLYVSDTLKPDPLSYYLLARS